MATRVAILGVKTLPAFAGADRVVERLLDHLPDGHEVTIYLLRSDASRLSCTGSRHYVYVPAVGGKHLRAFSYFFLCALHFLVKGPAGGVVHVHNSDFGPFTWLVRLKRGTRVVGTFHGNPYEREKWGRFAKAYLRFSEWCFVRACHALTSVADRADGRDAVAVIPNGVELWSRDESTPPGIGRAKGLEPGGYAMFACGRLDSTKGLHHLLDAYGLLPDAPPLLIVGDFHHDLAYSDSVRARIAADPRVVVHEELLDRETLYATIADARLFVFPSEIEAMSMVLLEALACGTTVVASDIPENTVVTGPDYPYLFRARDPSALASVMKRALEDADDPSSRRADWAASVAARFRWSEIAQRYANIYRREQDEAVSIPAHA